MLGDGDAQHGRMLYAVCAADAVLHQQGCFLVCTACHGQQAAAAAYAGVDMLQNDALLRQCLLNGLDTIG